MGLNIVLYEPEIASNTGNIIRTCVCTDTKLHLIRPFGFFLNDKQLKRAGMDYIKMSDIEVHDCFEEYLEKYQLEKMYFFTTKVKNNCFNVDFPQDAHLVFGPESRGLPEKVLNMNPKNNVTIPMTDHEYVRSLNLSNSVAIGLYAAMNSLNFSMIKTS